MICFYKKQLGAKYRLLRQQEWREKMEKIEKLRKRRTGSLKALAVLLTLYSISALIFFVLNALNIIDVFGVAEYETNRLMQMSSMGTCALGILTGILCVAKAESKNWYNILYVLCFCTIVFSAFITVGHVSQSNNIMATAVMAGTFIFAAICGTLVYKLRAGITQL